jgi:hypothetical protein
VFVQLADPARTLPFPIARGDTKERWLTGADLDPESFVRDAGWRRTARLCARSHSVHPRPLC